MITTGRSRIGSFWRPSQCAWAGPVAAAALLAGAGPPALVSGQSVEPEPIWFESHGDTVRGVFYRSPDAGLQPLLLHFHGFPGGTGDALGIGAAANAAGWNVMMFSPRGMHHSGGTFSFTNTLEDVDASLVFLRRERERLGITDGAVAVTGWSFGGWVALMAGMHRSEVGCVGAIAPANMGYVGRRARIDVTFLSGGRYLVEPAMRAGTVRSDWDAYITELLANSDEFDTIRRAGELRDKPVLVVGGWRDSGPVLEDWIAPLVRALRGAGNERVTPVVLDDDHGFGESRDRLHATVVSWLEQECVRAPRGG
ncbi:MAG TPA: alpha/beta fold hydrolase [Longimicrobiales bacterium]|nr:alpha/beta fold hydrolase [Longimicrobiales bacterium]